MEIKKSRWLQLALFCVINLFAGSFYVWSVFAGPLAERLADIAGHPVTAADLGMVFATASAVNPVAMILGGWANDRFGPRFVIPFGGAFIDLMGHYRYMFLWDAVFTAVGLVVLGIVYVEWRRRGDDSSGTVLEEESGSGGGRERAISL